MTEIHDNNSVLVGFGGQPAASADPNEDAVWAAFRNADATSPMRDTSAWQVWRDAAAWVLSLNATLVVQEPTDEECIDLAVEHEFGGESGGGIPREHYYRDSDVIELIRASICRYGRPAASATPTCPACCGLGSVDDPPWDIQKCLICHGTGRKGQP